MPRVPGVHSLVGEPEDQYLRGPIYELCSGDPKMSKIQYMVI